MRRVPLPAPTKILYTGVCVHITCITREKEFSHGAGKGNPRTVRRCLASQFRAKVRVRVHAAGFADPEFRCALASASQLLRDFFEQSGVSAPNLPAAATAVCSGAFCQTCERRNPRHRIATSAREALNAVAFERTTPLQHDLTRQDFSRSCELAKSPSAHAAWSAFRVRHARGAVKVVRHSTAEFI